MPPLPSHLRKPLTRRFQTALSTVGVATATKVQRIWAQLAGYDEADIDTFVEKTAPAFTAAKFASVRQASGYYALIAGIRPVTVSPSVIAVAIDPRDPFISTWRALKAGRGLEEAVLAGSARSEAIAHNLVNSSAMQTGDHVYKRAGLKVSHWERVPDGNACPWCLSVAPGFYKSAESADFGHDRDGCSAVPVFVDA